jgi:hypothetical protein
MSEDLDERGFRKYRADNKLWTYRLIAYFSYLIADKSHVSQLNSYVQNQKKAVSGRKSLTQESMA